MSDIKNHIKNWIIYKITSPSGRIYIGKSSNMQKRIYAYKHSSQPKQVHLHNSIKKYGFDAHKIEIIDELIGTLSQSNSKEMFWIRTYMCNHSKYPDMRGMNLTDGGEGFIGVKITEETRHKMREWHKNNPRKNMLGKKMSFESKQKMSIKKIGKSPPNKGKSMPLHQRELMRRINKGRPSWNKGKDYSYLSQQERKERFGSHNLGNSYNTGRKHSPEIVAAMIARKKGKPLIKKWKPVILYNLFWEEINRFPSIKEAAKILNINQGMISRVVAGKRISTHNFKFKYA